MWKLSIIVAAGCLLAGHAMPQTLSPPPGGVDFMRGQRAMRQRDTEGAIRHFEASLEANPRLFLSHYYLGYAYQALEDWENAGEQFEAFLQQVDRDDPLSEELVFHAKRQGGIALAKTDGYVRAIPYLEEVIAASPDDVHAQFFLGLAYSKKNEPSRALARFGKVIDLDAAFSEAYYYAGRISYAAGDGVPAERRLSQFLHLDPRSPHAAEAHFLLAALLLREPSLAPDPSEARSRAKDHLKRYLALEPAGRSAKRAEALLRELEETSRR